jgi:cytochrome b561
MSLPAAPQPADAPAYSAGARLLHWLVAALLATQFAVAWTMPDIHRGTPQGGLIDLHLSLGALILLLVVLRATLRFKRRRFPAAGGTGLLQHAAQVTHLALYALLLVLPLLGWANASSRGWTVNLFGLVPLPAILPGGSPIGPLLGDLHGLAATLLLIGVGLHVAAVLYHQVWLRQPLLQRMLPQPRGAAAGVAAGARR